MNQTIKNVLGGAIVLAVLAAGYGVLSFANSYGESIQPSSFRSFSVSGEGKAIAIPDVAEFQFTVVTEGGTDLASLQSKNTDAANKAIAFVKSTVWPRLSLKRPSSSTCKRMLKTSRWAFSISSRRITA